MSEPLQVKIMRGQQEIGTYTMLEVQKLLKEGTLMSTDLYWHKGMPDWVKLGLLQAEEFNAKAEEDRQVAEAVKIRLEKERKSQFHCNCCHSVFKAPMRFSQAGAMFLIIGALISALIGTIFLQRVAFITVILFTVSFLMGGAGFCLFLASLLRAPYCPSCESINFSKPE